MEQPSAEATTPYFIDPLNRAAEQAWANGIVVLAAAGNNGPSAESISVPGNDPYVITVGAVDEGRTPGYVGDDILDIHRLCFGCFGELKAPGACPRCGYDREEQAGEFPTALSPGTVLAGKYLAGRVLGRPGGFGIAYLGYELNLRARVAIKLNR